MMPNLQPIVDKTTELMGIYGYWYGIDKVMEYVGRGLLLFLVLGVLVGMIYAIAKSEC
jgi:hypothetical protein